MHRVDALALLLLAEFRAQSLMALAAHRPSAPPLVPHSHEACTPGP